MKKVIISYSQSPLQGIHSYWNDQFTILDEKFTDFSQLEGQELWLDAYIDLYDPRLTKPEYLYQFFTRIHYICEEAPISIKRILRNYHHQVSYSQLNKVFYLYQSFINFFVKAYEVYPIYIPDVLHKNYYYHPYNRLRSVKEIEWDKKSLFRVIQGEDIIANLLGYPLEKKPIIITGMKVSLLDLYEKISQIFGQPSVSLKNSYEIQVQEPLEGQFLTELNYNLESALIHQL